MQNTPPAGKVYLVGAGPGDPGLLTVRAQHVLREADLVLYDGLVNPLILRQTTAVCERTARTRTGQGRIVPQEQINARLIQAAHAGQTVVRLKGGDPFIFGRGSEEAQALHQAGISFEVVPGITAATAAGEYAGFSFTHRKLSSAVAFVTGHEDPTKPNSRIDFKSLASFPGTLVFYMGLGRVTEICQQLIDSGKSPATPAAIVCRASLTNQKVVTSVLSELPKMAAESGLAPPSLIVVGDCVQLRQHVSWFERQPLFGQTIAVTRPVQQADAVIDQIVRLGGNAVSLPLLQIDPITDNEALLAQQQLSDLSNIDWIIFTSSNGVHHFFRLLFEGKQDVRSIGHCRFAVVGTSTAACLQEYGILADVVPQNHSGNELAAELADHVADKNVLWVKADRARKTVQTALTAAGANVIPLTVYRNVDIDHLPPDSQRLLESAEIDWLCLSSPAAVRAFSQNIQQNKIVLPEELKFAAISPLTQSVANEAGFVTTVVPESATWEATICAIADFVKQPENE